MTTLQAWILIAEVGIIALAYLIGLFRGRAGVSMPQKFEVLAVYNAEVARGIVHTPEWDARMAELQAEFDQSDEDRIRDAMTEARDHPGRIITR